VGSDYINETCRTRLFWPFFSTKIKLFVVALIFAHDTVRKLTTSIERHDTAFVLQILVSYDGTTRDIYWEFTLGARERYKRDGTADDKTN
jgi:hypothetical protein